MYTRHCGFEPGDTEGVGVGSIVPHFAYIFPSCVMSTDGVGVGVILFIPPEGVGTGNPGVTDGVVVGVTVGVGDSNGQPSGIGV